MRIKQFEKVQNCDFLYIRIKIITSRTFLLRKRSYKQWDSQFIKDLFKKKKNT